MATTSIYETTFGTRHRPVGRPAKSEDGAAGEVLFPAGNAAPLIASIARRRAYAVLHQESRERLAEIFAIELSVLNQRGEDQVRKDVGL